VHQCREPVRPPPKGCTLRIGGENYFNGNFRCLASLPQEEISGYWVSGFEYSVFYPNRQTIKRGPDSEAPWLSLSDQAEAAVKSKIRGDEWQVFAVRFIGTKAGMRGIYGHQGMSKSGILMVRVIEIKEIKA
jgi:hypothetical protein